MHSAEFYSAREFREEFFSTEKERGQSNPYILEITKLANFGKENARHLERIREIY